MLVWLAVGVGGALGALGRWLIGEAFVSWSGAPGPLAATLTVNVLGCALIGLLYPLVSGRSPWLMGLVVSGFLGGFTTYSAFADETFALLDRGDANGVLLALGYVLITIATTTAAVHLGARFGSAEIRQARS